MSIRHQVFRLAERNDISFEEAEDILFDAAEFENDRRRDDALTEAGSNPVPPPQHPLHNLKETP